MSQDFYFLARSRQLHIEPDDRRGVFLVRLRNASGKRISASQLFSLSVYAVKTDRQRNLKASR